MMRLSEDEIGFHVHLLKKIRMPLVASTFVISCLLVIPTWITAESTAEINSNVDVVDESALVEVSDEKTDPKSDNQITSEQFVSKHVGTVFLDLAKRFGEARANAAPTDSLRNRVLNSTKRVAVWAATRRIEEEQKATTHTAENSPEAKGHLVLRNPRSNNGKILFLLGKEVFSLQAGEEMVVSADGTRTVRFHRGGEFGVGSYTIAHGIFVFEVSTSAGWQLSPLTR